MDKVIAMLFAMVALLASCTSSSIGSDMLSEFGNPFTEESYIAETAPIEETTPEETVVRDPIIIPEALQRFLDANGDTGMVLVYETVDMDLDGKLEFLLGTGMIGDEYTIDTMEALYLLREGDAGFENLVTPMTMGTTGYGMVGASTSLLQGLEEPFVVVFVSNGADLFGFEMYRYQDGGLTLHTSSASATGAGYDSLYDESGDGVNDSYYQQRWSYDSLYVSITRMFEWNGSDFVYRETYAGFGDHPDTAEGVAVEYLSLKMLSDEVSDDIHTRLSELCSSEEAQIAEFDLTVWYEKFSNWLILMDDMFSLVTEESEDTATTTIRFSDDTGKEINAVLHLVKADGLWTVSAVDQ